MGKLCSKPPCNCKKKFNNLIYKMEYKYGYYCIYNFPSFVVIYGDKFKYYLSLDFKLIEKYDGEIPRHCLQIQQVVYHHLQHMNLLTRNYPRY